MAGQQNTLFDTRPELWLLDAAGESVAASVVFAEPPHGPYDYAVPAAMAGRLKAGQRVMVPLGKGNRPVIGYCTAVNVRTGGQRRLKSVQRIVDPEPLSSPAMLKLAEWMADYYLCPLGQVLQTIVPAGVRGKAGTREMTFLSVSAEVQAQLARGELKLGEKQLDALNALAASSRPLTPPELAQAARCTLGPIGELRKRS